MVVLGGLRLYRWFRLFQVVLFSLGGMGWYKKSRWSEVVLGGLLVNCELRNSRSKSINFIMKVCNAKFRIFNIVINRDNIDRASNL